MRWSFLSKFLFRAVFLRAVFIPVQKRLEGLVADSAASLAANGCDTDPCAYWLWDGVQPTEAMHGFLAELWLRAAVDVLGFEMP